MIAASSGAGAFSLMAQQQQQPTALLNLPVPGTKVQAVLDTDTYNEIDDQYAVAYSLLSPDRMDIEAIYAAPYLNARSNSPEDGMQKSYDEIVRILKFLGRKPDNFAYAGSKRFMQSAADVVDSPAARDLIKRAMQARTTPLYVLTVGCPVNVSAAILMEPKIIEKIVVVWLGGTTHYWPSAREFNLQQDIHASRVLFDSGVPLVQIPTKNVAEHLRTTVPEVERFLKGRSRLGDYFYGQFLEYYATHTHGKAATYPWSKVIWDISAVAWIIEPRWVPTSLVPSPILTDKFEWKQGENRRPIRVATNVLRDEVFFDLFEKIAKT